MDKNIPNSSFFETYTTYELNNFRNKINNVLKENKDNNEKKNCSIANFKFEKKENLKNKSSNNNNNETNSNESIEESKKLGIDSDKDRLYFNSKSPVYGRKNIFSGDNSCLNNIRTNEYSNFALLNYKEKERIDTILKQKIINLGEKTRYLNI